MVRRYFAFFFCIIIISAFRATAQPTLPDIAGKAEDGYVTLSWNCQYDKVKAITVMRSVDSLSDYEIIGYVKDRAKGIQSYIDDDPETGRNYYKLSLVFKSGLTWRSNFIEVNVPEAGKTNPANKPEKPDPSRLESTFTPAAKSKKLPDTCRNTGNQVGINISFAAEPATNTTPVVPRPKITLPHVAETDNTPIFIKSKYIYTDTLTGHVNMFLPDDISAHSYSVKFFDKNKHLITEIPKISTREIIIDKRNFQRNGVYKFTIRKDYLELESGYIIINPTH
jgi:hypothetical protein